MTSKFQILRTIQNSKATTAPVHTNTYRTTIQQGSATQHKGQTPRNNKQYITMMRLTLLFLSLCVAALICSTPAMAALLRNKAEMPEGDSAKRNLQSRMDREFDDDVCKNGDNDYGECNRDKFPNCPGGTQICYNRKPFKDRFFDDNRQPKYYIDYGLVFCYPDNFEACSSCTPGRYCRSEARCILDEKDYPCVEWL